MKNHYFQLEKLMIPESISLAFHSFYLVICPFQGAGTPDFIRDLRQKMLLR
jgi:hypothetical protein